MRWINLTFAVTNLVLVQANVSLYVANGLVLHWWAITICSIAVSLCSLAFLLGKE